MTTPTMPEDAANTTFEADYSDQAGLFNPASVKATVTIIGCGGIGASVAPTLVTMGITRFILFDADIVEPRNVTTNLVFRPQDLYRPKVERMREYLLEYGAKSVEIYQEEYAGQVPLKGLVISGVDSMAARKAIWEHLMLNADVPLYMDGRVGGEFMTLLAFEPFNLTHIDWYEEHQLRDDDKTAPEPCTQRTIVYPAVALGCHMANYLATWSRGVKVPVQTDQGFGPHPFFQTIELPTDEDEN